MDKTSEKVKDVIDRLLARVIDKEQALHELDCEFLFPDLEAVRQNEIIKQLQGRLSDSEQCRLDNDKVYRELRNEKDNTIALLRKKLEESERIQQADRKEKNDACQKVASLTEERRRMVEALERLQERERSLEKVLQGRRKRVDELEEKIKSIRSQYETARRLETVNLNLSADNLRLESANESANAVIETISGQRDLARSALDDVKEELKKTYAERDELKEKNSNQASEIERLRWELHRYSFPMMHPSPAELKAENEELKGRNMDLLKQLSECNSELQAKGHCINHLNDDNRLLRQSYTDAVQKLRACRDMLNHVPL